jgi:hypothetical protein
MVLSGSDAKITLPQEKGDEHGMDEHYAGVSSQWSIKNYESRMNVYAHCMQEGLLKITLDSQPIEAMECHDEGQRMDRRPTWGRGIEFLMSCLSL